jgi:8-oxo-dGTP pyrophosphatase MutT (NUDIX family)
MEDIPDSWPVTSSDVQLRTRIIAVRSDKVQMPDQQLAERTVVTHPGAVAVLALDDADRVLMIRQYRHPVGRQLWEIPAGIRDADGESPLATAQRELLEEASCRAGRWHTLIDWFPSPGYTTERVRVFLARDLEAVADTGYERQHEEKFLVTEWVPLAAAVRLALDGKLHNGPAITGVLAGYAASAEGFSSLRPADAPET